MIAKYQEQFIASASSKKQSVSVGRAGFAGMLVLMAAYWGGLFNQLRIEWSANDQYTYGWFVPLLTAGLFWLRWQDRPQPKGDEAWGVELGTWGILLLVLALLPLRLLEEANVGWRGPYWIHACILAVGSLYLIWKTGGALQARHFAFPILFLLISVPWPTELEKIFIQNLMQVVAVTTVGIVHSLGVPGVRHGNLIEVGTGVVSVDGACSGVRSLQTSLMESLLLGEVFRLRMKWRVVLVGVGFVIAFAANVVRTSLLAWGAATHGMDYMEKKLHDPAGLMEVVAVLVALFAAAILISRIEDRYTAIGIRNRRLEEIQNEKPGGKEGTSRQTALNFSPRISTFNYSYIVVGLCWLILMEAATAYWFHRGDVRSVTNPVWSIAWPTNASAYVLSGLTKAEQATLRCDVGQKASWLDYSGNNWSLISLRWLPENKNAFLGHMHTPDQCFTGEGWLLREEPAPVRIRVNGLEFPFRRYVFEVDGKIAYAFLGFWDERSPGGQQDLPLAYGLEQRLKATWKAKHNRGFKKLEIAITGPASEAEAMTVLGNGLQKLIMVAPRAARRHESMRE